MRHPSEDVVRRLVAHPAGVADADRAHVADCPQCLDVLAAARTDPAGAPRPAPRRARAARRRSVLQRPAVAALAVVVVLAGASTAAANDWLQVFRAQQVAPVAFTAADLVALPDLSAYGDLELSNAPDIHEVADASAAAAETGLDVPEVSELPQGITGEPVVSVGKQVTATFTFSAEQAEQAAQAAAAAGEPLPPVPPGLDGSSVRLVAGPGVAQVWASSTGAPGLVVGRAVAPTAFSSGAPFVTLRDYLLSLPGVPEEVAAQLRTFTADGSTLPLPVPAGQVTTTSAEVDGAPATVFTTRDSALAAVVWVDDGTVTAVAGALGDDEVLSVARDLE